MESSVSESDPRGAERAGGGPAGGGVSLARLVVVLLRHRRTVVGMASAGGALLLALALLRPASYTSRASFLPQSGSDRASAVRGLATQLGIPVEGTDAVQPPRFYAELVRSRTVRDSVAATSFPTDDGSASPGGPEADGSAGQEREGGGTPLHEILGADGDSRHERIRDGARRLEERMSVTADRETGVVEVAVTMGSADLARRVADALLDRVRRFDVEIRQTRAAAEREFLRGRLEEARGELETAEDSLERFLERNRRYENSPALRFEHDRLQRRVDLRQQLYVSLSQSYEQARIDEVRNTPVLTVVVPPGRPPGPDPAGLLARMLFGVMFGGALGLVWAFGAESLQSGRTAGGVARGELERLWAETREDVRRLGRTITAPFRGSREGT